jgi:large subunit ribosomal protein L10
MPTGTPRQGNERRGQLLPTWTLLPQRQWTSFARNQAKGTSGAPGVTGKGGFMPTEAKMAAVAELKEELSNSKAAIVADYRGLTVSDISAVRRSLRSEGITYRVVKNRLAKIAATEAGRGELNELLDGPTALAMGSSDEVTLARVFLDAIKPYKTVVVRGGIVGEVRIDANNITRMAALPGREVLLAQLAGGMASPLATMASLLAAPLRNLGYALSQVAAQRAAAESAEEAPKAEAQKAEAPKAEAAPATPEAAAPEADATADAEASADEAPEAEASVADAPAAEAAEAEAPEGDVESPEAEASAEAASESADAEAAEAPEAEASESTESTDDSETKSE